MLMGDKNLVYPQRYIPFDLGRPLTNSDIDKIGEYCRNNLFKISPITDLLKEIAPDIVFKIIVSGNTNLYLFSYGIGVFVFNDNPYPSGDKFAKGYCQYRKQAHKEILEFNYGEFSNKIKIIIDDTRRIVSDKSNRPSASSNWEYSGLSYVMTVNYILNSNKICNYDELTKVEKKDLQILLQPSLAQEEATLSIKNTNKSNLDSYDFNIVNLDVPKDWVADSDVSLYISWASVVVYVTALDNKYIELIECLEVNLQAMWLLAYCQYINLKQHSEEKKMKSSFLKREKYVFQKKFNEFLSENDSSVPVYLSNIRNELIRTSNITLQKENYMEYIDFCIDEAESLEREHQKKYSALNEILLFIIAFMQVAPMIYNALIGNYNKLHILPVCIMLLIIVIGVVFILSKE